jgi:hypothetical protein
MIDDHFDWHLAAPHTTLALGRVGTSAKSPMTSFTIDFQGWWGTQPRGSFIQVFTGTFDDFKPASFVEFNNLQSVIKNRK